MINFRGIDTATDKKVYGVPMIHDSGQARIMTHFRETGVPEYEKSGAMYTVVHPDSIAQFTGLQDSTTWGQLTVSERVQWTLDGGTKESWKGKDIYGSVDIAGKMTQGGDVIYYMGDPYTIKYAINFASFIFESLHMNNTFIRNSLHMIFDNKRIPQTIASVLGNAYQNKELLK